ncbi:conserved hypothetical protein [Ricinus communis]|uniref:Uncharacterized protein n=2 Tax=Ricinus communis TaxID=3988 RepID=B9T131_RICCO|nr:conserved hypothetical protein [Ricinus communis]
MANDHDDSSHGISELYDREDIKMMIGKMENFFGELLVSASCYLVDEDSPRQLLVKLKELLRGTGTIAVLLATTRCYLDDPTHCNSFFSSRQVRW